MTFKSLTKLFSRWYYDPNGHAEATALRRTAAPQHNAASRTEPIPLLLAAHAPHSMAEAAQSAGLVHSASKVPWLLKILLV
ncbi:hypothetical protein MY8738_006582 [Beauveria namnaoensis]